MNDLEVSKVFVNLIDSIFILFFFKIAILLINEKNRINCRLFFLIHRIQIIIKKAMF